jgi:hypothetical protein
VRERRRPGRPLGFGAGHLPALYPGAREGRSHSSSIEKRSVWAERKRRPLAGRETG